MLNDERFKKLFSEQISEELKLLEEYEQNITVHEFSNEFEETMQTIVNGKKGFFKRFFKSVLNTTLKKVAFAATVLVFAFGAYFPAKAACSSVYNFVVEKIIEKDNVKVDSKPIVTTIHLVTTSIPEADDIIFDESIENIETGYVNTSETTAIKSEINYTTLEKDKLKIVIEATEGNFVPDNKSTETQVHKSPVGKITNAIEQEYKGYEMHIDAGNSPIADEAFLPSDYESASEFYNKNGETAVMKGGDRAVIVLPKLKKDNWKYIISDSCGINIKSIESYYSKDESGYDVYSIELDETGLRVGDRVYINFNFTLPDVYDSGLLTMFARAEDIKLNYIYAGNGTFEFDVQPVTVSASQRFIEKNGDIGVFGNKVCMVFQSVKDFKYVITEMKGVIGDSEPVTVKADNPMVFRDCEKVSTAYLTNLDCARQYFMSGYISSASFQLEHPGEYTVNVINYKNLEGVISTKEVIEKYATYVEVYYFNYDGTTVKINKVNSCHSGDVNMDGRIDIYDAIVLNNYLSGNAELSNEQFVLSDFNNDGKTDIDDVIKLLYYVKISLEDYNCDGVIDLIDAAILVNTFIDNKDILFEMYANELDIKLLIKLGYKFDIREIIISNLTKK